MQNNQSAKADPEGENREKGQDIFEKNNGSNFSNMKEFNLQIQEAQWTPSRINTKISIHGQKVKVIKTKDKKNNFKASQYSI